VDLHVDDFSNTRGCGVEVILKGLERILLEQSLCLDFKISNNQVKYETLIIALALTRNMGAKMLYEKVTPC